MTGQRSSLIADLAPHATLLDSAAPNLVLVQVDPGDSVRAVARLLAAADYHLVTVVGNDERELEDRRFKIYYLFSHPTDDLFVMVEYLLDRGAASYVSIHDVFAATDPFERELVDMLGLRPEGVRAADVEPGSWLHAVYPPALYPLRRDSTMAELRERVAGYFGGDETAAVIHRSFAPHAVTVPVGPIHAGIIESGQFLIDIAGETIEELRLRLGYGHRGIERIFQSQMRLLDGWRLAEQVAGDSSFAHSLAYCRAVEALTDTVVPPAAEILRGLFLELERMHNHVGDVAALAEDVGLDWLSAEFAVRREDLLRVNRQLAGHRYLRGLNRPGGVHHSGELDPDAGRRIDEINADFRRLADDMRGRSGFRNRAIGVGVLTAEEARLLGVTGLVARASGIDRDTRRHHPVGVYADRDLPAAPPSSAWAPAIAEAATGVAADEEACRGDVYARFLVRVREVATSHAIVRHLLARWAALSDADRHRLLVEPTVKPENNYTSAIGYSEGFRGDIVYWLMQDKMRGIFRCKVRDPSMLNWPALRRSVLPGRGPRRETMLADFPLINKSFNLSYCGNDL